MNKIIELDVLKIELDETRKILYEALFRLDKIKILVNSGEKVSKKQILEIVDGDLYEANE